MSTTETAEKISIFDPYGDLYLAVGENPTQQFRICSGTLARNSPVFRVMLYGGWAESQRTEGTDWKVALPADDPRVVRVLLAVLHTHAAGIPDYLDLDELHALVMLVGKYLMEMSLLGPYLPGWTQDLRELSFAKLCRFGVQRRRRVLHTAAVLGVAAVYEAAVRALAFQVRPSGRKAGRDPVLYDADFRIIKKAECPVPKGALDAINSQRKEWVNIIMILIRSLYEALLRKTKTNHRSSAGSTSAIHGELLDIFVGIMGRHHCLEHVVPSCSNPKFQGSVEDLMRWVSELAHVAEATRVGKGRTGAPLPFEIHCIVANIRHSVERGNWLLRHSDEDLGPTVRKPRVVEDLSEDDWHDEDDDDDDYNDDDDGDGDDWD